MTRTEGTKRLRARPDGAEYRWIEKSKAGDLEEVAIEHTRRPEWRIAGRTWAEALRLLDEAEKRGDQAAP